MIAMLAYLIAAVLAIGLVADSCITAYERRRKQLTFCYCKNCKNELCGDESTRCYDAGSEVHYVCGKCKWQTDFLFDAPVPIYLRSYDPSDPDGKEFTEA